MTDELFTTFADELGMATDTGVHTPGLSVTPGLQVVPDSPVPDTDRSHVLGPQQSAVDPVLAGLDTEYHPLSRAENRAPTRIDGVTVAAAPDAVSVAIPGPSGAGGEPASVAVDADVPFTPSV